MKIVLLRKTNTSKQSLENSDAEKYIRATFAHIAHLIWIKSIVRSTPQGSTPAGFDEQITIECSPQDPMMKDQALVKAVMDAVSIRSDLKLWSMTIIPTKHLDAIQQLDSHTYDADPYYSDLLARNRDYREEVKNKPVEKATLELQLKMIITSRLVTSSQPISRMLLKNLIQIIFTIASLQRLRIQKN